MINNILSLGAHEKLEYPIRNIGYIGKTSVRVIHIFCHSYSTRLSLCAGISLKAMKIETETADILAQNIYTTNTERLYGISHPCYSRHGQNNTMQ